MERLGLPHLAWRGPSARRVKIWNWRWRLEIYRVIEQLLPDNPAAIQMVEDVVVWAKIPYGQVLSPDILRKMMHLCGIARPTATVEFVSVPYPPWSQNQKI